MTWNFPEDLLEAAWVIIANAWNGNWEDAPSEWREAAAAWREAYHATLPTRVPTIAEAVRQATANPGQVFEADPGATE